MHLNRLRALVAVVEEGGFSQAARRLDISQPAVSQQIKALEADVAATLIERHTDPLRPTPAGRILYERAKAILTQWEEAEEEIRRLQERTVGRLTLGASTVPGTYLLPRLIFRFREENPRVDITVEVSDSDDVRQGVLNGRFDVGAVGSRRGDGRLVELPLGEDELLLIAPCSHPWSRRGTVSPQELLSQPLVMRERGSGTRETLEEALSAWGVAPQSLSIAVELGSTEAVVAAVEAGIGVSFVSRWAVGPALSLGRICTVRVDAPPIRRRFFLIARRGRAKDPLVRAFLALAQEGVSHPEP